MMLHLDKMALRKKATMLKLHKGIGGNMKIDVLREFLCLSEELNFSATARRFYINQSVLSRHIMDLEAELGCELFLRNKRAVRLTHAGKVLADNAPALIALHDDIALKVGCAAEGQAKEVSIGYLRGAASAFLASGKTLFRRDHPEIRVNVKSMQPSEIEEGIRKDFIDMGVTILPKGGISPIFDRSVLFEDEFALMVDKRSALASCDEIALEDLNVPIHVSKNFPHESQLAAMLRDRLERAGVDFSLVDDIDDVESMPMAFEGRDWASVSCGHLEKMFGDRFRFVRLKGIDLKYDVGITWKKSRYNAALRDLVECLTYGYEIAVKS